MMMNCFCGIVEHRKAFSLISSRDHCQRSSPSRISDTPRAGFEPVQNLRIWAVVITASTRRDEISLRLFKGISIPYGAPLMKILQTFPATELTFHFIKLRCVSWIQNFHILIFHNIKPWNYNTNRNNM